jgi:hypothetical protein
MRLWFSLIYHKNEIFCFWHTELEKKKEIIFQIFNGKEKNLW